MSIDPRQAGYEDALLNPVVEAALVKQTGCLIAGPMALVVDPNITLADFVKVLEQEGDR